MPAAASRAGLPGGVTPEEWLARSPKSIDDVLALIRESRAKRGAPSRASAASERGVEATATSSDGQWREWSPPSRSFHSLVYDSRRGRMLAVGGAYTPLRSVWQLSLDGVERWTPLAVAGELPPTTLNVFAAYDSVHDRVVAVANVADTPFPAAHLEVWALDLSGFPVWLPLTTSGAPGRTDYASGVVALDALHERLFLARGHRFTGSGELWSLDLGSTLAWTQLPNAAAPFYEPPTSLAYDDTRGRLVVASDLSLWGYDPDAGGPWTLIAELYPSVWASATRVLFDRGRDAYVVLGKEGLPVISVPASGGPIATLTPAEPSPMLLEDHFAAALDPLNDRIVAHGGWQDVGPAMSGTYALGLGGTGAWTSIAQKAAGARMGGEAVIDAARDRVLLLGGTFFYSGPADTILARPLGDPNASPYTIVTAPGPHPTLGTYGFSAIEDPANDRALVLIGWSDGQVSDELWSLTLGDPCAWTRLTPSGSGPGPRGYPGLLLDAPRNRLILMGGFASGGPAAGAWELSLSPALAWRQLVLVGDSDGSDVFDLFPGDDADHAVAWCSYTPDPALRLTIGADTLRIERYTTIGAPPLTHKTQPLVYDRSRHRLVVLEERYDAALQTNAFWSVTFGAAAIWEKVAIPGESPYARYLFPFVHDAARDRLVLCGGYDDTSRYFDDWWSLEWFLPTPTLVSLVDAHCDATVAHVEWRLDGSDAASVTVERRIDAGAWHALATLHPDGDHRVRLDDLGLAPGARVGYRLALDGATFGETWLDVPLDPAFALRGAVRNPAVGELEVAFSLARGATANLELLDLMGRRLESRRVTSDAGGEQRVTLASRGALAPGVYVVRLADGARALVRRAVLIR